MGTEIIESTALVLPTKDIIISGIKAVNEFQETVHRYLIKDSDWGIIPGTTKPTLLKPGAEKIAKLLGLADTYEILDKAENWQAPFFRYMVKCKLVHVGMNVVISEGMGECNSMESKYRWRWVSERDLPANADKNNLVSQERKSKQTGGHWTVYRLDNDDIYSQVNTILKMAKKRALVDAALSAGRLSDVFTQDIEDIPSMAQPEFTTEKPADRARTEPDKSEHYCTVHGVNFFKKGKMKGYAHKIEGTNEWCNEPQAKTAVADPKEEPEEQQEGSPSAVTTTGTPPEEKPKTQGQKLVDAMSETGYTENEIKEHIGNKYVVTSLRDLTPAQLKELTSDVLNYQVEKQGKD